MADSAFSLSLPERPSSRWKWLAYALIALSLIVRFAWYHVITTDYTYFVRVWFEQLQTHPGLSAFMNPFADYAPLYLYLLKLLTVFPFSSLYSAKTLTLVFDALIAYGAYLILKGASAWAERKDILFLSAAIFFAIPTVVINSSLWGQSDAFYAAGVMISLLCMLADFPVWAAVTFGVAVSFKVQAIFFAPILVGYLARRPETWKYLVLPPAVFVLTVIPAWLAGGSLRYWLFIYAKQSAEYPYLSVSAQSIYAFVQPISMSADLTAVLFWTGIVIATGIAAALGYGAYKTAWSAPRLVLLALTGALLLPYFLPRMHERYFYLADIFSVLYAFYMPNRLIVPIVIVGTSLLSYMPFLSEQVGFLSAFHVDLRIPALLLLLPIGIILHDLRAMKVFGEN